MRYDNAFEVLHLSMANATFEGLDDFLFFRRDLSRSSALSESERKACRELEAEKGQEAWPGEWLALRPALSQVEVVAMFMQTWGSTCLGFDGIGGAACTRAYTVVIQGPAGDLAVYFGGQLAYKIPLANAESETRELFNSDLAKCWLVEVSAAQKRYGAMIPKRKPVRKVRAKE